MTKISIQLNGIVRDINKQILKYYTKDINKDFDDKGIDTNVNGFISTLPFNNTKERDKFLYEDYPLEIFGSANPMTKGLMPKINEWLLNLHNSSETDAEVAFFSLKEYDLTLQSTYFFLGRLGSRVRETFFPVKSEEVWDRSDVVITNNKRVISTKPSSKIVVYIRNHSDNLETEKKCDFVYNSLEELLADNKFIPAVHTMLNARKRKTEGGFFTKIKKEIMNILS